MHPDTPRDVTRRDFIQTSVAGAAAMALTGSDTLVAQADQSAVVAEIAKQHDATVQKLREWIALPSIAAEDIGYPQGAEYMARLARDSIQRRRRCHPSVSQQPSLGSGGALERYAGSYRL